MSYKTRRIVISTLFVANLIADAVAITYYVIKSN